MHNRQHNGTNNTSLGSLLDVRVELSNGIDVPETQNSNQTYIHRYFKGIESGCLGGPAWGTEPNNSQQVWCVGIELKLILD